MLDMFDIFSLLLLLCLQEIVVLSGMAFSRSTRKPIWSVVNKLNALVQPNRGYISQSHTVKPTISPSQFANQILLTPVLTRSFTTEVSATEQINRIKQLGKEQVLPLKMSK